jgi:ribosomal protein S18 acetylase RimI-like enzyme
LDTVELNLIADLDQVPAGMAGGRVEGARTELISMWVAPFARGHAVGDALVEAVLEWAGATGRGSVFLQVMEGNEPAAALYRRHGFVDAGVAEGTGDRVERVMVREEQI